LRKGWGTNGNVAASEETAPGLKIELANLLSARPAWPEAHWKLRTTGVEREKNKKCKEQTHSIILCLGT